MKTNQFDEKQIADRGKSFQYGFIASLATILGMYFLTAIVGLQIDIDSLFLITLWIPMTTCFISLILKNAYEGIGSTGGKVVATFLGIAGLILSASSLYLAFTGSEALWENGAVTHNAGRVLSSLCMVAICAVYWIKRYSDNKLLESE